MHRFEGAVFASVSAGALCFGAAQLCAQPVYVQSATPAPPAGTTPATPSVVNAIGEVVVTAQRRTESTQRTSLVLDVVSAQALTKAGITQPQALTTVLPSVQIANVGPAVQVYIRGVGDFGSTANSNPSVPFNIDGVYVARSQSISSEFYDVDRVEVLKGPQGTLYGRNASGGAINIVTRKPVLGEWGGDLQGEIADYDSYSGEAAFNIPIGETVAVRASTQIVSKGGYTNEGYGDDKHQSGRLKLLWKPNDVVSLLLDGSYGHIGGKGPAFVLKNPLPGRDPWTDQTDPEARAFIASHLFSALPPSVSDLPTPNDGSNHIDVWNISAEFDANLGFATLTVLPAYRDATLNYTAINELKYQVGSSIGSIPPSPETSHMTSVEVRLGNDTPKLKWVLGGYFYNEDQNVDYLINSGLIQNSGLRYSYHTLSGAGFGQATYAITNSIRLIGGLRATSDQRQLMNGVTYYVSPTIQGNCLPPIAAPGSLCLAESYAGEKTFKNVSWKVGVEADLGPRSLFYTTASEGFKAGGFNTQSSPSTSAPPGTAFLFQPETLIAYEVGVKNRFLNNRLQFNVEGFYWNYKNLQEPTIAQDNVGVVALSFENAGKARMFGGSVDIIAKPWAGGAFSADTEYDNSKYLSFNLITPARNFIPGSTGCKVSAPNVAGNVDIDCSGMQVARAPDWSGHVGYDQRFDLANGGSISTDIDLIFASSRWLSTDFTSVERAKGYGTLNTALTYTPRGSRFNVTAFVRNITDAAAYTGAYSYPFYPGVAVANIQPPRTFGVNAGVKF